MRGGDRRLELAQRPRRRLGWVLAVVAGCSNSSGTGSQRGPVRVLDGRAERPTGCIDTPFVGAEARGPAAGIQCGREASPAAAMLRGRVMAATSTGLPGAGLEDLLVGVHVGAGLPLDRLPPPLAETRTGPQGAFTISLAGAGEYVIAVRAAAGGPVLAARRLVTTADAPPPELILLVPNE